MGRKREGSVRQIGKRWYFRLTLRSKKRREYPIPPPTDGLPFDEAYAKAWANRAVRDYENGGWDPEAPKPEDATVPSVAEWSLRWIKTQQHRTAKDEEGYIKNHLVGSTLGAMRVDRVTPGDVAEWVEWLCTRPSRRDNKPIAPRYVRSIYDVVRRAFARAKSKRIITVSPCDEDAAKALPVVADKDPTARQGWRLSRAEVHSLLFDERVPHDRRVLYAVSFMTGCRIGEAAALRWQDYETDAPCLGRLTIAVAYNRRTKTIERTKTGAVKYAPVHPTLRDVLAAWRREGWSRHQGKTPKDEDFIVPSKLHKPRGVYGTNEAFRRDCAKLGIRVRHQHCTRHTFVSLACDDGGREELLKRVTHAKPKEAFSLYNHTGWESVCVEVGKLRIGPIGETGKLPLYASGKAMELSHGSVANNEITTESDDTLRTQTASNPVGDAQYPAQFAPQNQPTASSSPLSSPFARRASLRLNLAYPRFSYCKHCRGSRRPELPQPQSTRQGAVQ